MVDRELIFDSSVKHVAWLDAHELPEFISTNLQLQFLLVFSESSLFLLEDSGGEGLLVGLSVDVVAVADELGAVDHGDALGRAPVGVVVYFGHEVLAAVLFSLIFDVFLR